MCGIAFIASLQHAPCGGPGDSSPPPHGPLPSGASPDGYSDSSHSATSPNGYSDKPLLAYRDDHPSTSQHSCTGDPGPLYARCVPTPSLYPHSELKPSLYPHSELKPSLYPPGELKPSLYPHADASLQRLRDALAVAISRRGPDSQSALHHLHASYPTTSTGTPETHPLHASYPTTSSGTPAAPPLHASYPTDPRGVGGPSGVGGSSVVGGGPSDILVAVELVRSVLQPSHGSCVGVASGTPAVRRGGTAVAMEFAGSVLQLRGEEPAQQPLRDAEGNVLLFNGTPP